MRTLNKKIVVKTLSVVALSFCAINSANASLVVTSNTDANALASALLGSGITVSNAVYSGDTGTNGSGFFSGGLSAGIGFDSGVLLTSGTVQNAVGPNSATDQSGDGTYSQLDFDFSFNNGNSGSVFFNYVFASEEYNEYVGSQYDDTFSLEVNGNNIAFLPNSSTTVAINNVNNDSNTAYYKDNNAGIYDVQYDGLTTVLIASVTGLTGTNHMTFNIHDVGDSILDSGVFIQGNSFSNKPTAAPIPAAIWLFGSGLMGLLGFRKKSIQALPV